MSTWLIIVEIYPLPSDERNGGEGQRAIRFSYYGSIKTASKLAGVSLSPNCETHADVWKVIICRSVEAAWPHRGMATQPWQLEFLSFNFFNLVVEARITVYTRFCHLSDQKSGCISIKFAGNRAKTPSHAFMPGPWWYCVYRAKHARDLFRLFCLLLLCMYYAIVSSK